MQGISNVPSHLLLTRKDNPASHSNQATRKGASDAFASYGFGPADTANGQSVSGSDKKKANGNISVSSATGGVGWLTQLAVSKGA
jgi:hypothetical protein